MKKFIAMTIVFVICMSLCACGSTETANTAHATENEVPEQPAIVDITDDFTVENPTMEVYYSQYGGTVKHYYVNMRCENYIALVEIGPSEYLLWQNGSVINGQLKIIVDNERNKLVRYNSFITDDTSHEVVWYEEL
jgi:hypothetical protein